MTPAVPLPEDAGPVIELFAHTPFAWFSDIDGAVSPIVERPEDAIVPERLRHLLSQLGRSVDHLVFVSGRSPALARAMVRIDGATYIGNHGLTRLEGDVERTLPEAEPYVERVAEVERQLASSLTVDGLILEKKGPVLALHYRTALDPDKARGEG